MASTILLPLDFIHNIYDHMIKRELLTTTLLLFIIWASPIFSQVTIDLSHNSMRTGDVTEWHKVIANNIWDLSSSEECGKPVAGSYEDFKVDTITYLFDGTRKYFVFHSDTLLYAGSENPTRKDSTYMPEVSYIFPMSFGDKHEGCFACYIDYCDMMRLHQYGTYSVQADTVGDLTLPDGNIIKDALQICHKRKHLYEQLETDTNMVFPAYGKEDIYQKLAIDEEAYTEIERDIFIKGYRYPIVKDFALYSPEHNLYARETYYFPLYEQDCLPLDEENMEVRREQHDMQHGEGADANSILSSYISVNRMASEIVFDCSGYISANPASYREQCRLLLTDSKGILYREKDFMLDSTITNDVIVSYSGLKRGQYVVSLIIGNQIFPSNFYLE